VAKPATVAIPVAEIRTPSLSAIEMIPTEERPVVPPLIQLPEWTNDPARIITWDAPPLPPENPYEQAARANQRSGTIAEPVRVPVSVHAPQRVRRHRVVDGDSWRLLSLRYYGDEEHMELLQQANRGLLTDPELLPVGVAIEIPQQ
jgi:nucleoid-associated protein YgaU